MRSLCICVHICVCVHVCTYVCVYMCMHAHDVFAYCDTVRRSCSWVKSVTNRLIKASIIIARDVTSSMFSTHVYCWGGGGRLPTFTSWLGPCLMFVVALQ